MVTRQDVARAAGVSPSTVSYVLSGKRTISQETRRRVEEVMRELAYTPHAAARSLASSRNGVIALHYPAGGTGLNTTEFEYLTAASQHAQALGYHLLLWSGPVDDVEALRGLVGSHAVDGVLVMEVRMEDPRIPMLEASGLPFALLGRPADPEGLVCVDDDFEALGRAAVDHLADLGHREVLYLGLSAEHVAAGHGPTLRTLEALEGAATRRGVGLRRFHAASTTAEGERVLEHLLSLEPRPTAVIGFNELALSGLLRASALRGVDVPGDLSVVGLSFPDTMAEILAPPLTTVAPSPQALAEAAVGTLTRLVEGRPLAERCVLLEPTLTARGSSGPAPGATPDGGSVDRSGR